jgi:uncharacterized protein (DUF488 family)
MRVYTVAPSNPTLDAFLEVLREHGVRQLADVRRWPRSRRHPHFSDENLKAALRKAGVEWRHFEALGGMRKPRAGSPNVGWETEGFQGYADYLSTDDFQGALEELTAWAGEAPTAVMCAEARPSQCHRRLIADALAVRDVAVIHVGAGGEDGIHEVTSFAEVVEGELVYPFTLQG